MAVGAQLVTALGDLQAGDRAVVVVVDDLHWSDELSARALLFAVRRMRADRVLGLVAARTGGLDRLGEGWSRFASGDHRVTRLRLDGLTGRDLAAMARSLGAGDLSGRAIAQLLEHTGGNALHCGALLEELGPGGLERAGHDSLGSGVRKATRLLSRPSPLFVGEDRLACLHRRSSRHVRVGHLLSRGRAGVCVKRSGCPHC
jgi:hypothetical protein